jgi:hypothetical protein
MGLFKGFYLFLSTTHHSNNSQVKLFTPTRKVNRIQHKAGSDGIVIGATRGQMAFRDQRYRKKP